MRSSLLIAVSLLTFNLFGQKISEQLKKITTVEQANIFIEKYSKSEPKLFTITSDSDTSGITVPLFEKSLGFTFSIGDLNYKILETESFSAFRASYIYLDGSQLTLKSIDSLREVILNKYKSGTSFVDLVKEYTMDGNPTGDTGWFTEHMMMSEFEAAVRKHKFNEVFIVDIPSNKWHYVALKTFDNRQIKKLTILRVKSST